MKKEPIGDLQLLFLRLIAEEAPQAATVLFNYGDGGKPLMNLLASLEWMEHYGVYADWLELFLRDVLEQGQEHIDWVVKNRESFGQASFWSHPRKRPAKHSPGRSAQAEAWLRTLKTYQAGQAMSREASKRHPDRITYSDPTVDKRKGEEHCRWLIERRFNGKSDSDIAKDRDVSRSEIGKLQRDFADKIDLNLKKRRRS